MRLAVLTGLEGGEAIEAAYVETEVHGGVGYFTSKCVFGLEGVKEVLPYGELSECEEGRIRPFIATLMSF